MDMHTHFRREDTRIPITFVRQRRAVGNAGWNSELVGEPQTIEDLRPVSEERDDDCRARARQQGRMRRTPFSPPGAAGPARDSNTRAPMKTELDQGYTGSRGGLSRGRLQARSGFIGR